MTRRTTVMHSGEVTFLDGKVEIVSVWLEKGIPYARHPRLWENVRLKFIEEYEGVRCYDEVEEPKQGRPKLSGV